MSLDLLSCAPHELVHHAHHAIEHAEFALTEFGSTQYEGKIAEANEWRRVWLERGHELNTLLSPDGLTTHEMVWLVWAHLRMVSHIANRSNPYRATALDTHAEVRMITREFNDFGAKHLPRLRGLEETCVRVAVLGPEADPPLPPDANKGTKLDEAKGLFMIQAAHDIDFDTEYHDHRDPKNQGKRAWYKPKRWEPVKFVADCSRLFYWSTLQARLFSSAQCIESAITDPMAMEALSNLLMSHAHLQTTNQTDRVATNLYYELRLPLGAWAHMERNVRVGHTALVAIQRDCGSKHLNALTDLVTIEPLPAIENTDHAMHDAWLWTMWSRLMNAHGIEWFAEYFCMPHELQTKKKHLETRLMWRTRPRRPIICFALGAYFVQYATDEGHKFWRCVSALHALSTWCVMMKDKYQSETVHRQPMKLLLNDICSFPRL